MSTPTRAVTDLGQRARIDTFAHTAVFLARMCVSAIQPSHMFFTPCVLDRTDIKINDLHESLPCHICYDFLTFI